MQLLFSLYRIACSAPRGCHISEPAPNLFLLPCQPGTLCCVTQYRFPSDSCQRLVGAPRNTQNCCRIDGVARLATSTVCGQRDTDGVMSECLPLAIADTSGVVAWEAVLVRASKLQQPSPPGPNASATLADATALCRWSSVWMSARASVGADQSIAFCRS